MAKNSHRPRSRDFKRLSRPVSATTQGKMSVITEPIPEDVRARMPKMKKTFLKRSFINMVFPGRMEITS